MRLVSFNLLHGRALDDDRVDAARLRAALGSLDGDVLALQEVDRDQDRSSRLDLTALAADAIGADPADARFEPALLGTPGSTWRPARTSETGGSPAYGVALVSRHRVTRWLRIPLGCSPLTLPLLVAGPPRRVRLVRDEPRVAIAAVLDASAPVRTVIATHLSFVPGWNLAQLFRLAWTVRRLPGPVVLLGDLNLPGRLPAAALPGWRSLGRVPTYPADAPRVQLDHALVRESPTAQAPRVIAVDAVRAAVSDHRALVVDLAEG